MAESEPSYIDYESFLEPEFSASKYANGLLLSTNNATDTSLDLSTPLSRVLFDLQEIDTHLHTLTTKEALPLLTHTQENTNASQDIVHTVDEQVANLTAGYERLQKEVVQRWEAADEVRIAVERLWQTVRIGRSVGRCLQLGRQLEVQMAELGSGAGKKEDHRAMARASNTILSLRQLFLASKAGEEGEGLDRVDVVTTLKNGLVFPAERDIKTKAQQIIREFSMSSLSTASNSNASFTQTEEMKSRSTSAFIALYLLSPSSLTTTEADFVPELLLQALQSYQQTALTSSVAAISRALSQLPQLERTLLEVSARCQNLVALEALLEMTNSPSLPYVTADGESPRAQNLLQPLLQALDTTSLPSHFWRSLSSSLASRVQDIMSRGGVSARTLRSNRDRVRDAVRECVVRGSQVPRGMTTGTKSVEKRAAMGWEREVGVMVGAVAGPLGR
jgi:Golgi transport complex subunit 5